MIEEEATVALVEPERVWVEKQRVSSCASCEQSCASSMTARMFSPKIARIPVATSMPLEVGDRVLLGIREEALVLGALRVYLLPLVALFAGAMLGKIVVSTDWAVMLGGAAGLGVYFVGLKAFGFVGQAHLEPVILRKIR